MGAACLAQFWLLYDCDSSFGNIHFFIFRVLFEFVPKRKSWNQCEIFYLRSTVEAAISLTFDCFSILTRVLENHFQLFFSFFFRLFFNLENSVGRLLILNIVWERLSHLTLTAFRFWLEFRKSIVWHLSTFPRLFNFIYCSWN